MLEKEFEYYKNNQDSLLKDYKGKYLIIVGETVVGAHDSIEDAYLEATKKFNRGSFLIQHCIPGHDSFTVNIYTTRVAFA